MLQEHSPNALGSHHCCWRRREQQIWKPIQSESASKFVIPSSAHGNGGCPEHLENALAAQQANNSAYVTKQRTLRPAVVVPRDFPTMGGNDNMGKASSDSGKNKKSYKDVAESGINWVGDSPQIWTRQLLSDQEWSQGILSSELEGAKWQTFEEVGEALLEHDRYVRSLLLNTVMQWLNVLPTFVMNEILICIGLASGNH